MEHRDLLAASIGHWLGAGQVPKARSSSAAAKREGEAPSACAVHLVLLTGSGPLSCSTTWHQARVGPLRSLWYSLGVTAALPTLSTTHDAVLFDLDGTLLDTLEDLADAMNQVLAHHDLAPHPVEAYKLFVGDGIEWLVRRASAPRVLEDAELKARVEEMKQAYRQRADRKTRPYPGVEELLDALVARGLRLAILSNKPQDAVLRLHGQLLARWPFDPVWGARPDLPRKPDPTGALRLVQQTGVPAGRWLYLGDTGIDMRTARAAGMTAVGVLWGFRGADELREAGAEHLLEAPPGLLDIFGL